MVRPGLCDRAWLARGVVWDDSPMAGEYAVHASGGGPGPPRPGSGQPAHPQSGAVPADFPVAAEFRHDAGPDTGPDTGLIAMPMPAAIDDALLAARTKLAVAETRLAESHDEAQSIIRDAVEQATLISDRAESSAQELLLEARQQADELTAHSRTEADEVRRDASQMMADAQTGSRQLRERLTADLGQQLAEQERALRERLEAHEAQLAATTATAAEGVERHRAQAVASAAKLVESAARELENARLDAVTSRSDAAAEGRQLLEAARADAAREMDAAADQTRWTEQIIGGLLEAADLDAQRIRKAARADSAAAIRRTHGRLASILAASRERVVRRLAAAEHEAAAVAQEATSRLDRAAVDAIQMREQADADSCRIVAEAEDTAAAHLERAERRLAEAESGARAVREQVADDLTRAQRQIHDLRRAAKAEEAQTIDAARAEADAVRATARKLLADAKAEVVALVQRRNAIAGELGNLSGVIEALAVTEAPRSGPPPDATTAAPPTPPPAEPGDVTSPHRTAPEDVVELETAPRSAAPERTELDRPHHDNQPTSLLDEMMRSE